MEGRAEWLDLGRDVAVDKLSKKFCQAPNPDNAATDPTRMESTSKASQIWHLHVKWRGVNWQNQVSTAHSLHALRLKICFSPYFNSCSMGIQVYPGNYLEFSQFPVIESPRTFSQPTECQWATADHSFLRASPKRGFPLK